LRSQLLTTPIWVERITASSRRRPPAMSEVELVEPRRCPAGFAENLGYVLRFG
jgi:hypothetical protein